MRFDPGTEARLAGLYINDSTSARTCDGKAKIMANRRPKNQFQSQFPEADNYIYGLMERIAEARDLQALQGKETELQYMLDQVSAGLKQCARQQNKIIANHVEGLIGQCREEERRCGKTVNINAQTININRAKNVA